MFAPRFVFHAFDDIQHIFGFYVFLMFVFSIYVCPQPFWIYNGASIEVYSLQSWDLLRSMSLSKASSPSTAATKGSSKGSKGKPYLYNPPAVPVDDLLVSHAQTMMVGEIDEMELRSLEEKIEDIKEALGERDHKGNRQSGDWPSNWVIDKPLSSEEGRSKVKLLHELSELLQRRSKFYYLKIPIKEKEINTPIHERTVSNLAAFELNWPSSNEGIRRFAQHALHQDIQASFFQPGAKLLTSKLSVFFKEFPDVQPRGATSN